MALSWWLNYKENIHYMESRWHCLGGSSTRRIDYMESRWNCLGGSSTRRIHYMERRWHWLGVLASKTVVKNYSSIHRNFFPPTFSLVYLCIFLYTANVTPQPDKSPYTPYGLISLVSQAIWDSNDILILGNTRVRIMILTLNGNSDHISHA